MLLSFQATSPKVVANTYQLGTVSQPDIGVAADGTSTMVWTDSELDGSGNGVYARRFDLQGNALGAPFRINSTTAGDQIEPRIAMRPDGTAVVTWVHNPNPGSERPEFYVRAQRLDASGAKVGGEIVVNAGLPYNQSIRDPDPQVVFNADGGFSILYNDQPSSLPPSWPPYVGDYITARYDAAGAFVGEVNSVLNHDDDGWETYRTPALLTVGPDGTIYLPQLERRARHTFIPDVGPLDRYDVRLIVTPLTPSGERAAADWVVSQVLDTPDSTVYDRGAPNGQPNVPHLFARPDGTLLVGYTAPSGVTEYVLQPFSTAGVPLAARTALSGGLLPTQFVMLSDGSFANFAGEGIPFGNDVLTLNSISPTGVVDPNAVLIDDSLYYFGDLKLVPDRNGGVWAAWDGWRSNQIFMRHFVPADSHPLTPGTISFESATYQVNESAGAVSITLRRDGGSDGELTVSVNSENLSAGDNDYLEDFDGSPYVVFADGETQRTIHLSIVDDAEVESDETFALNLHGLNGAAIGAVARAVVNIIDNDEPPDDEPSRVAGAKADYDGDGKTDLLLFRATDGDRWLGSLSSNGALYDIRFGDSSHGDVPAPGDYDGDGRCDLAVYRPSNAVWIIRLSGGGTRVMSMGDPRAGDVAAPGDYDGDGTTDLAVFRPAAATWIIQLSSGSVKVVSMGDPAQGDVAIPGDYDGDGITDPAVFRPSTATWIARLSGGGVMVTTMGDAGHHDLPIPGDYDGDGITDLAVFRPSTATWILRQSGGAVRIFQKGEPNLIDVPVTAPSATLSQSGLVVRSFGFAAVPSASADHAGAAPSPVAPQPTNVPALVPLRRRVVAQDTTTSDSLTTSIAKATRWR